MGRLVRRATSLRMCCGHFLKKMLKKISTPSTAFLAQE